MAHPQVSIVVATYKRPDALRYAIASAQRQSFTDWHMLVIGDHCGPETGAAIQEIGDPRIDFINLPVRCGEQSGPNSVGMALADTPYIAFLNHDDIWAPDHLERAVAALENTGRDLFIGRARFCVLDELDRWKLVEETPAQRKLSDAFFGRDYLFEPASAWVFRKSLYERVGAWRPMTRLYRRSIVDWLLRAWRSGAQLCTDDKVCVLKPRESDVEASSNTYAANSNPLAKLLSAWDDNGAIIANPPEAILVDASDPEFRNFLPRQMKLPGLPPFTPPVLPSLYKVTGMDGFSVLERIKLRGDSAHWQREVLQRRVGEKLPPPYDLDALVEDARRRASKGMSV